MDIRPLTPDLHAAWDAFAASRPDSCVYHSSAWMRLLREVLGYRSASLVLLRGGEVRGGLPLHLVPGLFGRRISSSPFRDRGGVLALDDEDRAALLKAAADLCRELGCRTAVVKEAFPSSPEPWRSLGFQEQRHWVTTVVDLSPGPDALWKGLKNNAQGPVKQARSHGLEIRSGTGSGDVEAFSRLFFQTRLRLGIPCFPEGLFRAMGEGLGPSGSLRLLLAAKDGRPVAGMLLLAWGATVLDGYAASSPEGQALRANDLLTWTALEWAASQGYARFDFGGDSPRQEGLLAYKRKWGGVHVPLVHYALRTDGRPVRVADSSESVFRPARRVVSRLPEWAYRRLSALITPRLG